MTYKVIIKDKGYVKHGLGFQLADRLSKESQFGTLNYTENIAHSQHRLCIKLDWY